MTLNPRFMSSASFDYRAVMPDNQKPEAPDYGDYEPKLLDLISDTDIRLRQQVPEFDFTDPPIDPMNLSFDLIHTMLYHEGLGLSANQCGLPYRVFVLKHEPFMVCFNPRILAYSETETKTMQEGCLSFPTLAVEVERPASVRVRFQTPDSDTHTQVFAGVTARVFQHEFDHMEGLTFLDHLSALKKDKALRVYQKNKRMRKAIQKNQ